LIIGLTGGIASGKTTTAKILEKQGAYIIDADQISRKIMKKGEEGWQQVVALFGQEILDEAQEIKRSQLAEIVFANEDKLKKLEAITHPLILKEIRKQLKKNRERELIVLEAPLLFEVGIEDYVDQVWVVYVDRQTQLKRLCNRNGLSTEEAIRRIEAQLPLSEKRKRADVVIDNNGSLQDLKENVLKALSNIKVE